MGVFLNLCCLWRSITSCRFASKRMESVGSDISINSFIHAGSTFANDAFSRVRDVKIHTGVDNLLHFVFALPYTQMYQSPMKFRDFRDSSSASALKNCFTFFLEFVYSIGAASSSKNATLAFDNIVCILEACQHESKDRFVGTRVHVFTTRCKDELTKLKETLQYNMESTRKHVKMEEYEQHRVINTAYSYAGRVFNVYTNTTGGTANVDSMFVDTSDHKLLPSNLFSADMMAIPNAKYNLCTDYQRDGAFVFPDEDRIFRISPDMLKPEIFMTRYLPDYLMYRVNPPEAHLKFIGSSFRWQLTLKSHSLRVDPPGLNLVNDMMEFEGSPSTTLDEIIALLKHFRVVKVSQDNVEMSSSFDFFSFRSLFSGTDEVDDTSYMSMEKMGSKVLYHPMLISQSGLSDLDLIKVRGDLLKGDMNEVKRKEFMLSELNQRCWGDTDANISKPLKAVVRWFNNDYSGATFQWAPHYEDMSVFANRAIRCMKIFDKLFCMSTAHHAFFLLVHAKLDSWRHEMNLHFNVCSTGDAATSKSFLYETMIETSVPGTCPEFTYETAKSNAHDDNNNHLRNIFHEAPQGMFTSNKHTDPQQEAAFKERLTSQKTSHRRLHIDEHTGVRKQVSSVSQAIGCYFGASNDPKSKSTPAMITRFHWLESEKVHREGRNIHDCRRAHDTMDNTAKKARASAIEYFRLEDTIVAFTFQMIRVGLLTPPTLAVADIIVDNFTVLLKKYGIIYDGRTIERTKTLCCILTIVNAKEQLFHTPGGKHCGKRFHPSQLMDMDTLMVCTEEIALHAIGQMFNSIEAENHKKVTNAIWKLHNRTREYRGSDAIGGVPVDIDYSYIAMDGLKRLKQQIHGTIQEAEGKIGESAIESVLEEMSKQQIMCSSYEEASGVFNDGFPGPTASQKFRCEKLIRNGSKTYIHMEIFRGVREGTFSDLFKECLHEIRHKYTLRRKILLGRRIRNVQGAVLHPHLFDTVMMQPANQSLLVSGGTVYDDNDSDIIDIHSVDNQTDKLLNEDLDTYGRRKRATVLGKEVRKFEPIITGIHRSYPDTSLSTLFKKRKRVVKH